MKSPGPQQASIGREVLRTQQWLDFQRRQQQFQGLGRPLLIEKPVTIFGKRDGVPNMVDGIQPVEPTEEQVVAQLLIQDPLRADAVYSLQQYVDSSCSGGIEGRPPSE